MISKMIHLCVKKILFQPCIILMVRSILKVFFIVSLGLGITLIGKQWLKSKSLVSMVEEVRRAKA